MELAKTLKTIRERSGMTQEELASQAELSVSMVEKIEQGRRRPTLQALNRLAEALKVKPGSLLR